MKNSVFIATSLDGYIADTEGGITFLDVIPEINEIDTGYHAFIADKDALVMGRSTFEKVLSFGIEWPYTLPVYVVSTTLTSIPKELASKVFIVKGTISEILSTIHGNGHNHLYIDGGKLIQSFLTEDLIDEMIITVIPVLLGGGYPLFGVMDQQRLFHCVSSMVYLEKIVQNRFVRSRSL